MLTLQPNRIRCSNKGDWLARRRSGIGASDSAGILGVGYANQSPLTIWDSKVNDRPDDYENDERMQTALAMEPALRSILERKTGYPVHHQDRWTIHQHPELEWMLATLDSEVEDPEYGLCPGELKAVDFGRGDWGDGQTPLKFQVQLNHQMFVTGARRGYLLGLLGLNPVVRVIERNERFINSMVRRLREFWDYVERRELPPIDSSLATAQTLSKLWPEDNGLTTNLPDEATTWSDDLEKAKADKKDAEAREVGAANLIKAAMADATFGMLPDGRQYSWKRQERDGYYVKPTSFRVLRLKS